MPLEVVCVGDLLVEIMRDEVDEPLDVTGVFVGPFPSGASGIFVDAIARLGVKAGFIGAVGQDDFGDLILEKLKTDGVNVDKIRILSSHTTGVAFVTYFSDGSRKFIYHLPRAATGQLYPAYIEDAYFSGVKYLHIVGSTTSINKNCRQTCYQAVKTAKKAGVNISLDPNLRPELLSPKEIRDFLDPILSECNVVFPSQEEAEAITGKSSTVEACRELLDRGCQIVALKQGKDGSFVFTKKREFKVPGFSVEEKDPTGAGDCYCAGFVAGLVRNMDLEDAARVANAVGALAVTKKGPMEGAPMLEDVRDMTGIDLQPS